MRDRVVQLVHGGLPIYPRFEGVGRHRPATSRPGGALEWGRR
jgi:hypothetical protein